MPLPSRSIVNPELLHGRLELLLDGLGVLGRARGYGTRKRKRGGVEAIRVRKSEPPGQALYFTEKITGGKSYTYMSTSTSLPFSSRAGLTSNAHRMRAMLMETEAAPRCMPGQMRRPQPKAL